MTQATTAVGLSYEDVVAGLRPNMPMLTLRRGQLSRTAKVWIRTPLLIQTSHTHLFGMTLLAGLLGLIFLFSGSCAESLKACILALPFAGTMLDIGGMWLTRFVWPPFAALVLAGGTLFGLGYLLITGICLYELWCKKETHS